MRIGIIAEGHADIAIIRWVMKALTGIDCEDMIAIRPSDQYDETDISEMKFSNWELVMKSCRNENNEFDKLFCPVFESVADDDNAILVVQIDTAERGMKNFDVHEPPRSGHPDWKDYSAKLRENVKSKIENLIPLKYRSYVSYAIAIEETDAWVIPLFDSKKGDSATYIKSKEKLRDLVSRLKGNSKYINTNAKNLNYHNIGRELVKGNNLQKAREGNASLDLFCIEVVEKIGK